MKTNAIQSAVFVAVMNLVVAVSSAADPTTPDRDIVVRTELSLKTPRSRDPVLGGSREKVFFQIWIPAGVTTVRGAICNPFSKDEPVSKHWQAACRHWKFAYLQADFDGVKKDDFPLLPTALIELAKQSGHPEIEHMPFCWTGMSRGGGMSMQFSELMPERTIASVPVCLEVGPASEATRRIPVLTVFGEKDGSQMEKLLGKLPAERNLDARWSIAVQWGRKHEFGQANNLSFVFLDDVIARRLPADTSADKPLALNAFPLEEGWIGDQSTWSKDGTRPAIHAWNDSPTERTQCCWLPSKRVAAAWQSFVAGTKEITINEPGGLGDGQKFELHPASQPVAVKLTVDGRLKPARVELWDAEQRLAERTAEPWAFEASLKPGIHALFATVQGTDNSVRNSRLHTIVVGE